MSNGVALESLLKQKQTYLEKILGNIKAKKEEKKSLEKELDELLFKENSLKKEIKDLKMSSSDIIISEHAILRYIERVLNIDIEQIKSKIQESIEIDQIKVLGNGIYPITDSTKAVIRNNVIVTIE